MSFFIEYNHFRIGFWSSVCHIIELLLHLFSVFENLLIDKVLYFSVFLHKLSKKTLIDDFSVIYEVSFY